MHKERETEKENRVNDPRPIRWQGTSTSWFHFVTRRKIKADDPSTSAGGNKACLSWCSVSSVRLSNEVLPLRDLGAPTNRSTAIDWGTLGIGYELNILGQENKIKIDETTLSSYNPKYPTLFKAVLSTTMYTMTYIDICIDTILQIPFNIFC